ncbi:MAG: archaeosortase/exosortase family protein, partial [Pirellulales bacterium]|nr:archaeosortase/exosortase family protein [Pirellulales bacterium]
MFWCDQRLQLTIDGPGTSRSLVIPRPYARIGADESADVVLPHEATGGRRWYLHATGNGVYCVELGKSVKPTRRRGRWVTPTQELELGTHSLYVKSVSGNGGPDAAGNVAGDRPEAGEKPVVQFVSGTQSPRRRQLGRLTIVGNDRPSHLRIDDAELEAAHCVLYWSADSLWVVDLLSSGGTWRDGTRYEVTSLSRGDSIQIGQTTLTLLGAMARPERSDSEPALEHPDEESDLHSELRSQELATREVQVKREERLLEKLRSREERLQARQQQRAAAWNVQRAKQGRALETRAHELDTREAELQQREAELVRRQQPPNHPPAKSEKPPAAVEDRSAASGDAPPVLPVNELQAWRLQRMDPPPAEVPQGPGGDEGQVSRGERRGERAVTKPAVPAPRLASDGGRLARAGVPVAVSVTVALATWPLIAAHGETLWYRADYQLFPLVMVLAMLLFWLRRPNTANTGVAVRSGLESPLALLTVLFLFLGVALPSPELAVAGSLGMAGVLLLHDAGRTALAHWALPWMLLWLVIPLPQGWDLRLQISFETLVGRVADYGLRIVAGAVIVPTDHALLEMACTSWTAPMVSTAVGVFLVLRRSRHWLSRTFLLAAVIPFSLLVSVLVVVLERWEYAVAGDSRPLLLVGSGVVLFAVDASLGVLLRRRAREGQLDSAAVSSEVDEFVVAGRRAAWHWWLTVPLLLVLAGFQSVLWWQPGIVLSRDRVRQGGAFPHAAWKQGNLPKLEWQGEAIEPGPVEVIASGLSQLQSYRWRIQCPEFEMRLA